MRFKGTPPFPFLEVTRFGRKSSVEDVVLIGTVITGVVHEYHTGDIWDLSSSP